MTEVIEQFRPDRGFTRSVLLWIARLGYAGRGMVFLLLGLFAALSAFGVGWQPLGTTELLFHLPRLPSGWLLLIFLALGLLCFAVYRAVDAIFDVHGYGSDGKAILRRLALGCSGICYAGMTLVATSAIFGWGEKSSGDQSVRDWAAWIMSLPAGDWLVAAGGLAILAVGIGLGAMAAKSSSSNERVRFHQKEKPAADVLGKLGYLARSLIFVMIGGFVVLAAANHNPQDAEGFAGALKILKQQSYGSILLGMTGMGMLCFGLFGIAEAFRAEVPER